MGTLSSDFPETGRRPAASFAQADLAGQNGNQADAAYILTNGLVSIGSAWTASSDTFALSEPAQYVEVSAIATYAYDSGNSMNAGLQRVAPLLKLLKNGVLVAVSASAYQRHNSGHNDSSNTIVYTDLSPSLGDVWQVRMERGSTQTGVLLVTHGQFTVKAMQ